MSRDRIKWIDIAKGIGIILVVLGHTPITKDLKHFIYTFHMPLFFFLSGYIFKLKDGEKLYDFTRKKFRTVLIPYFVFSLISFFFYVFINNKILRIPMIKKSEILKQFIGIFISDGSVKWMSWNVALWFLTCLFITEILFYIIVRCAQRDLDILLILSVFSLIGWIDRGRVLPWNANFSLSYVLFFGIGYIVKKNIIHIDINKKIYRVPLAIVFLLSIILIGYVFPNILKYNHSSTYLIYNVSAFVGIVACVLISQIIPSSRLLMFIGKNSLIILALHNLVYICIKGFISNVLNIPITLTQNSNMWGITYTIFEIAIILPIIFIINRYIPFITGKTK